MNKKLAAITLVAATALAPTVPAMAGDVAGIFGQGHTHFSISGGNGYAFDETYLVIGLGVSYYLMDGLNVGLQAESWSNADPSMYKLTPSLQYVFYQIPGFNPYVGGFYRRQYIDGLPDINSAGGRAGFYIAASRSAYIGIGAVYESYLDCDKAIYTACSNTYPEVSFTVSF
jgi:hypothetical protein